MKKYIILFFTFGCKLAEYPSNQKPQFDYSEYTFYNCPHNSDQINDDCEIDKAK